jgi:hypothetical protein
MEPLEVDAGFRAKCRYKYESVWLRAKARSEAEAYGTRDLPSGKLD